MRRASGTITAGEIELTIAPNINVRRKPSPSRKCAAIATAANRKEEVDQRQRERGTNPTANHVEIQAEARFKKNDDRRNRCKKGTIRNPA
jgi:hypothetical protein